MKYPDGQEIKVGDKLKEAYCGDKYHGIVVASIDTGQYIAEHTKEDWDFLKVEVLVNTNFGGLVHYMEPQEDWVLVERNSKP